jgi:hypothetical protein
VIRDKGFSEANNNTQINAQEENNKDETNKKGEDGIK